METRPRAISDDYACDVLRIIASSLAGKKHLDGSDLKVFASQMQIALDTYEALKKQEELDRCKLMVPNCS